MLPEQRLHPRDANSGLWNTEYRQSGRIDYTSSHTRRILGLLRPSMLELRELPALQGLKGHGAGLVIHEGLNRKRQENWTEHEPQQS